MVDDTIVNMRAGIKDGITLPKLITEEVIAQVKGMVKEDSIAKVFLDPLGQLPKDLDAPTQAKLEAEIRAAVKDGVMPAYSRLLAFLEKDYLPASKPAPGEWALPDGKARYAYDVKVQTTTDLTPAEIHAIGLKEVARIETEMTAIAKRLGYADLGSFRAFIARDPKLHPKDGAELIARYSGYLDGMKAKLPEYFGLLPKAPSSSWRWRPTAKRTPPPPSTKARRRMAPGRAASMWTPTTRASAPCSPAKAPATTRACRAITCRSPSSRS